MAQRRTRLGVPVAGAFADFDAGDTKAHRIGVGLDAALAPKVIKSAKALGVSVSWYLAELARRDEVNEDGLPLWSAEGRSERQLQLPTNDLQDRKAS